MALQNFQFSAEILAFSVSKFQRWLKYFSVSFVYLDMNIANKQIAIIGGGPGGLTLARLLQLKGARVKVYERDLHQTARIQGGALDLHTESGLAALTKAGLMEEFKRITDPVRNCAGSLTSS